GAGGGTVGPIPHTCPGYRRMARGWAPEAYRGSTEARLPRNARRDLRRRTALLSPQADPATWQEDCRAGSGATAPAAHSGQEGPLCDRLFLQPLSGQEIRKAVQEGQVVLDATAEFPGEAERHRDPQGPVLRHHQRSRQGAD